MEEDDEATVSSDSLPLSVKVGVDDGGEICNPIKFFDVDGENVMVGSGLGAFSLVTVEECDLYFFVVCINMPTIDVVVL